MRDPAPSLFDRPVVFGAVHTVGLGALAGALEATTLAASSKLPMSALSFLVLGVVDVLVMAGFALVVAIGVGVPLFSRPAFRAPTGDPTVGWAWQATAVAFALTAWYLGFEAWMRLDRGDPIVGVLALAAMPIGFAGVAFYNARFWFRWVQRHPDRPWGWPMAAGAASGILVVLATVGFTLRRPPSGGFDDDKSAVIVTVDGWRHDQVALVDGGPDTPNLLRMAEEPTGVWFADAVTPTPESRAANATVVTGLHPLRHQVFDDADVLSARYPTVFGVVRDEGWPTAGFVSSSVAARASGIGKDLHVLDDALSGGAWLGQIDLLDRLQALFGRADDHRAATDTVERFANWVTRHGAGPFVAWVHLDDPLHAARQGEDPAVATAAVDAAIGRIRAVLAETGHDERTLLVVTGTHGASDGAVPNRSLRDPVVRVPLFVSAPGEPISLARVEAQVRLLDVINTVSEWLELPPIDTSEGVSLLDYARGQRRKTIWCALVGRDAEGRWLLGLRNNGVKYWTDRDGNAQLFYLPDDPDETTNLVSDQPNVLQQARALLVSDEVAMKKLLWRP